MERKEKIMKRVQEHYNYLIENGYNVAFIALQGSQNYELDLYTDFYMSDIDTKAVVIPTLKDIVSGQAPLSTTIVLENNEHIDVKDIRMMTEMWKKQNISYLEILFTEYKICNPDYEPILALLFENADTIATYNHIAFYKAIKGMALEKEKALCHPYPNTMEKIEKYGYDPKQLHHIVRLYEMVTRLEEGEPLRTCWVAREKNHLLDIKCGLYPLFQALEMSRLGIKLITQICDQLAAEDKPIGNDAKEILSLCTQTLIEKSIRTELREG